MANAETADRHISLDFFAQRSEAADALLDANMLPVVDSNARRIIAAILEFRETIQQELRCLAISNITDNSTHKNTS